MPCRGAAVNSQSALPDRIMGPLGKVEYPSTTLVGSMGNYGGIPWSIMISAEELELQSLVGSDIRKTLDEIDRQRSPSSVSLF